jgi:hypothetical protein
LSDYFFSLQSIVWRHSRTPTFERARYQQYVLELIADQDNA